MIRTFIIPCCILAMSSCNEAGQSTVGKDEVQTADTIPARQMNLAKEESLFDGKTFNGWHGFNKEGAITNWAIEDSALVCLGAAPDAHGGDIVTDKEYGNFDLSWEWKVTRKANSGLMYHVVESKKYQAPYETGPEYQMIDDIGFPSRLEDWQKSAADYAMYTPNAEKKLAPVGEWNTSRIVFNNGHVQHWLNGKLVIEFTAWDADWTKRKNEGKWKTYPDYGMAKKGRIALQDHGQKVYFRNIRIREILD